MPSRNVDGEIVVGINQPESLKVMNEDLKKILSQMNNLEAVISHAKLDKNAAEELLKQIRDLKATVNVSNIEIDQNKADKDAQKVGQNIGSAINQGVTSSLKNIKNDITNTIKSIPRLDASKIIKEMNLNRDSVESDVVNQVRLLVSEINNLGLEVAKTGSDGSWDKLISKGTELGKTLDDFGRTRNYPAIEEIKKLADYFHGKTISVGYRSSGLSGTDFSVSQLNKELKDLGVRFSATKQEAVELDSVWEEMCNTTGRMDLLNIATAQDQLQTIISELQQADSLMHGEKGLVDFPNAHGVVSEYFDCVEKARKVVANLETEISALAQKETQDSTSAADKVVQNEDRKQQAYERTADAQRQIASVESLIKSGGNIVSFENTNDAAREASRYFKELLEDENALISVSERFNKANELASFAVNIKRASGEVETLRYALENIGSENDPFYVFKNIGAELNNSGALKQMQQMEKTLTDYQAKLDNLKTKYSRTSMDYSGFETVFNNFKQGIGTVNDLKTAFNQLENSAKISVQSLKSQRASLDPIQNVINNMKDIPTMLKNLETNMAGLQNKTGLVGISVDDLTSRYMKLKSEMDATGGKVPLDGSWAKEYQKLMSDVVASTRRVAAEQKKAEKSNQSFFASLKKNFSFLSYWTSANYIFMTTIRKIKEMVGNVHELEEALVDINYTMELSGRQLKEIGESSLQMAKDLNTSAGNILGAVKLYANAKESAESILQKAQPAIMLSNVTGFSGEESAKYLQTIMNQFDLTQDDLMGISDTIQAISQSIAHDFADGIVQINEGIATSGEVARAAGMDLSEYASMIGLLVEKTGLQGSQLGNSLKTIITRTTKAGKIMGIDEGEISDAEKSLRSVGIEVRKTDGEFKDFNDTMSELSKQWDSLSDVEKSNISFNLAGTRQINVIQTLLRNWSDYEDLVNKANNSTGVTLENQQKYAESLTGKLGELSAIWSNISNDAVDSSFLKGLADAGIAVSSLIEKFGLLKTTIASVGIAAFVKNFA